MKIIEGKFLLEWASNVILGIDDAFDADKSQALGILGGDGEIIAVCVYHNYQTDIKNQPLLIEMSIASIDKRWATRYSLERLFDYPFTQLGLGRVQAITSANAEGVNRFLKRVGFSLEGVHRKAHPLGGDAYSWSMLKEECRWVNPAPKLPPLQTQ